MLANMQAYFRRQLHCSILSSPYYYQLSVFTLRAKKQIKNNGCGADITFRASDKCIAERRKTITGDDILFAMATLGFDN